jgi:L-ascorbate metabolism protein UlaG (beta-lactamase superfamily)
VSTVQFTLTYLGVAGWRLDDGAYTLLVDPYFSRRSVESSELIVPDSAAIARYAPSRADGILVGHSHYDHLLDVPEIARRTHAAVFGSESSLNVARAAEVPEAQLHEVHAGSLLSIGPFAVRVLQGRHSLTGVASFDIPRAVTLPMTAGAYGEGGTLHFLVKVAGHSLLFIDSANFVESELNGLRPDLAIIAVGLREKIPDYSCRLMRLLGGPRLVFENHFDAHWEPLGPKQMDIEPEAGTGLAKFATEIHACSPDTRVVVPMHFEAMKL